MDEKNPTMIRFLIAPTSEKHVKRVGELRNAVFTELSELYPTTRFEIDGEKILAIADQPPESEKLLKQCAERMSNDVVRITWEFFKEEGRSKYASVLEWTSTILYGLSLASIFVSVILAVYFVVLFVLKFFVKE